ALVNDGAENFWREAELVKTHRRGFQTNL
ncbi:MAG: hypothetical protein QG572_1619, partial [Pseudomonadota bacterium]|nr:hypothetical protein [Pseudomonadota bacterium]